MSNLKTQNPFKGIFAYLITPLDDKENLKTTELERLCKYLIQQGVHGLTPLGSTGECSYLSQIQRHDVVDTVVSATKGEAFVIPAVSSNSVRGAIEQASSYASMGVDGIVLTLDAYFPLSQSSVKEYFLRVADAVDLPIIIYTNPIFQKVDLSTDILIDLSYDSRFVGLKDASTNTGRLLSLERQCRTGFGIYAASAHITTSVMLLGGSGLFAGPVCVLPREYILLYKLCERKQWNEAMEVQRILWRFNEAFATHNLAGCIKVALLGQGFDPGPTVSPQPVLSNDIQQEIQQIVVEVQKQVSDLVSSFNLDASLL